MARRDWPRVMESAEIIGCDPNRIYRLARQGKVRTRRSPGGPREFFRADLERVRDGSPTPAAAARATVQPQEASS